MAGKDPPRRRCSLMNTGSWTAQDAGKQLKKYLKYWKKSTNIDASRADNWENPAFWINWISSVSKERTQIFKLFKGSSLHFSRETEAWADRGPSGISVPHPKSTLPVKARKRHKLWSTHLKRGKTSFQTIGVKRRWRPRIGPSVSFIVIAHGLRPSGDDIVNAVEKEYKLLFNRRTFGPPAHKVRVRFL